jgi:hypothetical protein
VWGWPRYETVTKVFGVLRLTDVDFLGIRGLGEILLMQKPEKVIREHCNGNMSSKNRPLEIYWVTIFGLFSQQWVNCASMSASDSGCGHPWEIT